MEIKLFLNTLNFPYYLKREIQDIFTRNNITNLDSCFDKILVVNTGST